MIILGISPSHDAGAAIIEDGKVVSAVNEERLNRVKMYWGFPEESIMEVIRLAKIRPQDIDYVAMSNLSMYGHKDGKTPKERMINTYVRRKTSVEKKLMYTVSRLGLAGSREFTRAGLAFSELRTRIGLKGIRKVLSRMGINAKIVLVEHHKSHAASAFMTSGYKDCISYSSDYAGDFVCCSVYRCGGRSFERLMDVPFYHSPAMVYSYVTYMLGFTPNKHEGKITGLAAYGDPNRTYDVFSKYMGLSSNGMQYERKTRGFWYLRAIDMLKGDLAGVSREDISAGVQKRLEDVIGGHVKNVLEAWPESNVALSGGIFANVKVNQRVHETEGVKNVFVHPHMGDGGLGVGAAMALWMDLRLADGKQIRTNAIQNVYLGPSFTDDEIRTELRRQGVEFDEHGDVEGRVAELIAKGKVIGRFDGRMEYGPRALGNRSILYKPTDKSVNDWLNKRLKRTEFMPFAPSTLYKYRNSSYRGVKGSEHTAKFMTITYDCTDSFVKSCPAVSHIDNTARPQLVTEKEKSYHRIIDEYRKITGLSTIVNTSFNMHEEPIVCTPEDAIRSFKTGKLDYLAIGNFIVKN